MQLIAFMLIDGYNPDIEVLTQAREDLINRGVSKRSLEEKSNLLCARRMLAATV